MSNSLLRPATFEERGAVVPFTSPTLSLARVRADPRERLVLMMPVFGSEQGGAYVAPWRSVPDLTRMSIHDRALHDEISLTEATTPERVRAAALKIARTGLAGPSAADSARRGLEADRRRLSDLQKSFARSLLIGMDLDSGEPGAFEQSGDAWRVRIKPSLTRAAQILGIEAGDLQTRIDLLSQLIAPTQRFRGMREQFPKFRISMAEWAEFETTDLASLGGFAAMVAADTQALADKMIEPLDRSLADIALVMRDWAARIKPIALLATRLGWLLDGWDFIFAFWEGVESAPIDEQRETVIQLLRILPLIPRNEMDTDEEELTRRHQQLQDRQPQSKADWRTSRQELDLASRIERVKAMVMLA
jgi:hypothetical protein